MSTRREDTSSGKQRFSSEDADARQEGSSPDQRTAEPDAFRDPPKVAPKFAREYVGTESPAARLMRLAQGLAGKRSEQAKKPAADDQRSAPPPHSAPPKFNPKFAKEFIGTPPPRAEQASSSTPPPPKPPNTPPPFDPRFSSEYVGNRSPFAAKGQAAGSAAPPPPPPPPPAPSVPPPKVDAKYAKETIVRPSPFTAAGASAKPSPKPSKPASAQARPTAKAASGAKPPPPPRQAPPPRPSAASVPPPKVAAKYAKESVGTPSPFTTGGASAKPAPKPSKPASTQTRPVAKAAAGPKPSTAKPAAAAPIQGFDAGGMAVAFRLKMKETIDIDAYVARLANGVARPNAVLLIDHHAFQFDKRTKAPTGPRKARQIRAFVSALRRWSPGLDVTLWSPHPGRGLAEPLTAFCALERIRCAFYEGVFGSADPHDRHVVIAHAGGLCHWHGTNDIFGFRTEGTHPSVSIYWNGSFTLYRAPADVLPMYDEASAAYRSALGLV